MLPLYTAINLDCSIQEIYCVPLDHLINKNLDFLIKMLWSIVLIAFCKSIRTIVVRRPELKPFVILSWRYDKQVSVEWNFWKPDWYLYRTLLSDRKFIFWSWIISSIILETSGSSEMGLKSFGSVLRPFLHKGLIFATLHLSGKEVSLMERYNKKFSYTIKSLATNRTYEMINHIGEHLNCDAQNLFCRKIVFCSQDIQVFVFLTSPWFTESVMSWWLLVHGARYIFEYIFWTTTNEVAKCGQLIDITKGNNLKNGKLKMVNVNH